MHYLGLQNKIDLQVDKLSMIYFQSLCILGLKTRGGADVAI